MAKTPSAGDGADPNEAGEGKNTRPVAASTPDAKEVANHVRADVQTAVDALGECVRELAEYTRALAGESRDQTREKVCDAAARTEAYVARKPLQSVVMAAVAGAVLALLLGRRP